MRIAEVIGTVTLSRRHPNLQGGSFRVAVPLSLENLRRSDAPRAEPLIAYDDLGAGVGSLVGVSEGREAAQPFPEDKAIDAYVAAILDDIFLPTPAAGGQ